MENNGVIHYHIGISSDYYAKMYFPAHVMFNTTASEVLVIIYLITALIQL